MGKTGRKRRARRKNKANHGKRPNAWGRPRADGVPSGGFGPAQARHLPQERISCHSGGSGPRPGTTSVAGGRVTLPTASLPVSGERGRRAVAAQGAGRASAAATLGETVSLTLIC